MPRKLQPFPWYGGKYRMVNFLLSHMPSGDQHFVDVFGGSGVVLLNKPTAGFDTYNDIDGNLVNFFRVLRDDGDNLIRLLELTPYSREECENAYTKKDDLTISNLERARMFYCRARFSYSGMGQSEISAYFTYSKDVADKRCGAAVKVSAFINNIERLPEMINRLRRVQIENLSALDIIKRYDTASTFFYCDPPYVHSTRKPGATQRYTGEMSDTEHLNFSERLKCIKGKAMVSGYRGGLYNNLFSGWRRVDEGPRYSLTAKMDRNESIWMNYEASGARIQMCNYLQLPGR